MMLLSACATSPAEPHDASLSRDVASDPDAGRPPLAPTARVDILFVIDAFSYATRLQGALSEATPAFLHALASGDVDRDGVPEQPAVRSLRAGVITADLGAGVVEDYGCGPDGGDDAQLIDGARTMTEHAALQVLEEGDEVDTVAHALADLYRVGSDDCFVVQALEAALKALSPARATSWTAPGYVAPAFERGAGHGDGANAGLVRDESVLVIVLVTAHDDASTADLSLYDLASDRYDGELPVRSVRHPEALRPVERYVRGLLALRDDPRRVVVATVLGAPPAAVSDPRDVDAEALLAHPDMQIRFEPGRTWPLPACLRGASGVSAYPGRRLLEHAAAMRDAGAHVVIESACVESFDRFTDALAREIGLALAGE
ncbi:hypothetical protein [Sandaracinus amylolyticus]|uniref:hypothetical protein n=1 Tax=Sandaracinus amylolyticus TaxID=927083 RepID=UPI0012EECB57|nr:hypothetical protein [Sandaracinus amylolyticus]